MNATEERIATWRRIRGRVVNMRDSMTLGELVTAYKVLEVVADELGVEASAVVVEVAPARDVPARVET